MANQTVANVQHRHGDPLRADPTHECRLAVNFSWCMDCVRRQVLLNNSDGESGNSIRPVNRVESRTHFSSAITKQHGVWGEEFHKAREVSIPSCLEEFSGDAFGFFSSGIETVML